jgi:hypothetical protein
MSLEDVEAIEKAEEIIALLKPGRDGIGLGLGDISNALLKEPGEKVQWQHPYLTEASAKGQSNLPEKRYSNGRNGLADT